MTQKGPELTGLAWRCRASHIARCLQAPSISIDESDAVTSAKSGLGHDLIGSSRLLRVGPDTGMCVALHRDWPAM
ncbi:hypothetical protein An09g04500 [Aspergillus niger]|uniref:Uncharacterized protein n=2 Tax=Aspergillus niger TaxID=5061 RepID=A2QU61_ASPNC|nr:hypothetical protein An09g04500 [Aspergillus niger]CAK40304.1 hypothetical protein An09g04500 [Aspergillus niger]